MQASAAETKENTDAKSIYIHVPCSENVAHGIEELEKIAKETANSSGPDQLKCLDNALEDLLYLARDRDKRNRIIKFLGSLLSGLYVNGRVQEGKADASNIICWKLCLVTFASSMQDILWYPKTVDSSFVVLMLGFGGSHMDDLRPAMEAWSSRYGADVLACGPALRGRREMLDVVFEKLISLLADGRHLVVHLCSDAGFSVFRAFLKLWSERVTDGTTSITSAQVMRYVVSDCAGLGSGDQGIIKDGTFMDGADASTDRQINSRAKSFFAGSGINMFMHAGACTKVDEEPADSFFAALGVCAKSDVFAKEARHFSDVLWGDMQHFLAGVPILIFSSKADRVVPLKRCEFLADCCRRIPERKSAVAERWPDGGERRLGSDGLAVHMHVFEKAAHCRAFLSNPEEYWEVVDGFMTQESKAAVGKKETDVKPTYIHVPCTRSTAHDGEELERLARERAHGSSPDQLDLLDSVLEDLLYVARDREKRNQIIKFLGSLLSGLYANGRVQEGKADASNIICWKLCLVTFASSMQDILWYPKTVDRSFVVLMFGFGGSHMDDLRPAMEAWSSRHGAEVLACGPALRGRREMLDVLFEKLMSLLADGRHLVVHMCSDAGFSVFRAFLKLWSERVTDGTTSITSAQAMRCIVSDCAGLGNGDQGIIKDGTFMDGADASTDKKINNTAKSFFAGSGINMFMHAGACTKVDEEPADSFFTAVGMCAKSDVFVKEARHLSDVLWDDMQDFIAGVPILIFSSKADRVVPLKRCEFLADCCRRIPERKSALAARWPDGDDKNLGSDGLAVHMHVFEKALHCRAFLSNPEEYWAVVARLMLPCIF